MQGDHDDSRNEGVTARRRNLRTAAADRAFDLWLQRGLSAVYGEIADEPLPEALLALIDLHRQRQP